MTRPIATLHRKATSPAEFVGDPACPWCAAPERTVPAEVCLVGNAPGAARMRSDYWCAACWDRWRAVVWPGAAVQHILVMELAEELAADGPEEERRTDEGNDRSL